MVTGILTVAAVLAALLCQAAAAGLPLCLRCHPAHYAGRGECISCHRGNPASDRKQIAHHQLVSGRFATFTRSDSAVVRYGKHLAEQKGCRRCHRIGGQGTGLSVDLDDSSGRIRPESLAASIQHPAPGMPDFRMTGEQATSLVTFLLAAAQDAPRSAPEAARPRRVLFDNAGRSGSDVFSRSCGPCHRVLSHQRGALGAGIAGPNLSALFSDYYPRRLQGRERWTERDLNEWVAYPRRIKRQSLMRPVTLTAAEFSELIGILRSHADSDGQLE